MEHHNPKATLLISSQDRAGIIAGVWNLLYSRGCNIIDSDQHSDDQDGHFFWRIFFESRQLDFGRLREVLAEPLATMFPEIGMSWRLYDAARQHERIVIVVSKLAHCMMDLLSRHHAGELDAEVAVVVSNHPDLAPLVKPFGVPFEVIPVTKDTKAQSEQRLLELARALNCDSIVLARYMQILSADLLKAWDKPIVNIHHSFCRRLVARGPISRRTSVG